MPTQQKKRDYRKELYGYWNEHVAPFKTFCRSAGIILILAAVLCLFYPELDQPAVKVTAGILLAAAGIGEIVAYVQVPSFFHMSGETLSAFVKIVSGIIVIIMRVEDAYLIFAFLLAADRILAGLRDTVFYRRVRRSGIKGAVGFAVSGILNILSTIAIAVLLYTESELGTILAIYFFGCGAALLTNMIGIRKLPEE
jgi:uncharacterized membrane protein HdeD (DUF308 family)